MRTKKLMVALPVDEYSRLEMLAAAQERDPWRQAQFLLRQALQGDGPQQQLHELSRVPDNPSEE